MKNNFLLNRVAPLALYAASAFIGYATTFNLTNDYALALNTSFANTNAAGKFVFSTNALLQPTGTASLSYTGAWRAVAFANTNAGFVFATWTNSLTQPGARMSQLFSNRFQISAAQMAGTFGSGAISNAAPGGGGTIGVITNTPGENTNAPAAIPQPVVVYAGTNSPENILTAGRGSIYNQFDTGTGTNFAQQWIKRTTTGSAGWVENTNLVAATTDTNYTTIGVPFVGVVSMRDNFQVGVWVPDTPDASAGNYYMANPTNWFATNGYSIRLVLDGAWYAEILDAATNVTAYYTPGAGTWETCPTPSQLYTLMYNPDTPTNMMWVGGIFYFADTVATNLTFVRAISDGKVYLDANATFPAYGTIGFPQLPFKSPEIAFQKGNHSGTNVISSGVYINPPILGTLFDLTNVTLLGTNKLTTIFQPPNNDRGSFYFTGPVYLEHLTCYDVDGRENTNGTIYDCTILATNGAAWYQINGSNGYTLRFDSCTFGKRGLGGGACSLAVNDDYAVGTWPWWSGLTNSSFTLTNCNVTDGIKFGSGKVYAYNCTLTWILNSTAWSSKGSNGYCYFSGCVFTNTSASITNIFNSAGATFYLTNCTGYRTNIYDPLSKVTGSITLLP